MKTGSLKRNQEMVSITLKLQNFRGISARAPLFENSGFATELSSFNDSLNSVNAIEILNLKNKLD
jgi:hypothetical protein